MLKWQNARASIELNRPLCPALLIRQNNVAFWFLCEFTYNFMCIEMTFAQKIRASNPRAVHIAQAKICWAICKLHVISELWWLSLAWITLKFFFAIISTILHCNDFNRLAWLAYSNELWTPHAAFLDYCSSAICTLLSRLQVLVDAYAFLFVWCPNQRRTTHDLIIGFDYQSINRH